MHPPADDELSTVLQHRFDPSPAPDRRFQLVVVDGPDRGRAFGIDGSQPSVLLGQSEVCELRLSDRLVSRRHASLEVVGAAIRVTDLASSNGTFVGELAVERAWLRGGELLKVGGTTLRVEPGQPGAATAVPMDGRFGALLGSSLEMRRLYPLCAKLAASDVPCVIEGETGTGKEILAESIHEMGARASQPFVVFDCTAVNPNLAESELFGHERGAFTGAVGQRKGVFELAHGGTLLIDEIGDLDRTLQPKLLRAAERAEIRRVGGDRWIPVDVRILAATRRDLDREVQEGRFRDDLFHRLAVARIELPPLRQRRGDVAVLAQHFWSQLGGAPGGPSPDIIARWERHPWPGNVRELRNAVARHVALGSDGVPPPEGTPPSIPPVAGDFIDGVVASGVPLVRGRAIVVDAYERRYIERVLEAHGGNVVHAARASGIARRHFQRLKARRNRG